SSYCWFCGAVSTNSAPAAPAKRLSEISTYSVYWPIQDACFPEVFPECSLNTAPLLLAYDCKQPHGFGGGTGECFCCSRDWLRPVTAASAWPADRDVK